MNYQNILDGFFHFSFFNIHSVKGLTFDPVSLKILKNTWSETLTRGFGGEGLIKFSLKGLQVFLMP